eukprot:31670-Eustigmatos_ZCMA.PRE.1
MIISFTRLTKASSMITSVYDLPIRFSGAMASLRRLAAERDTPCHQLDDAPDHVGTVRGLWLSIVAEWDALLDSGGMCDHHLFRPPREMSGSAMDFEDS